MAALPGLLEQKPSHETRWKVFHGLFHNSLGRVDQSQFQQYFRYYERELAMLKFGSLTVQSPTNQLVVTRHEELVEVADIVRSAVSNKSELRKMLQDRYSGEEAAADRTLNLLVRLWLMVNVREPDAALHAPQTYLLQWSSQQTLQDFVADAFPTSKWRVEARESRLHPSFTAAFMVNICGLKLEWTDCLADHLRLDRRHHALRVYSYKSLLQVHLNSHGDDALASDRMSVSKRIERDNPNGHSPFPGRLLLETIWTLNLLFPQWDPNTNSLLKKHQQSFQQIGPYNGPPTSNLAQFEYWRDRLCELHDVVFLAPPASWAQLWRDRRNPQQFWTFWLALVILLLTLISTITGIVQAWASIKSLDY
ncbi:hypothetical protein LTR46_003060 [Exophiala xenobiotica]|nr:hypothetical protein LTR46_003060 [Exophiala xenobiotica]